MMKQKYIDIVTNAFRKGEFKAVSGGNVLRRSYDEAYIDERNDYDFGHMYIRLLKDEREADFIEVYAVDTEDECMTDHTEPSELFTDFFKRSMEDKLWYLTAKFDPERRYELEGTYEVFGRDFSIVAFYVIKMI